MRQLKSFFLVVCLLTAAACRKEVEKIVVQDKQYSWMAYPGFTDSFGILLGSGKGPTGLYFQQPVGFAALEGKPGGSLSYGQYVSWGSGNLSTRFLIGPEFFAAYYDSVVWLVPNTQPVTSHVGGRIRLKSLDPQAQYIQPSAYLATPFAALSKNNYLLFPYESGRYDFKNRLILSHVTTTSTFNLPIYATQSKIIELPLAPNAYNNYQPRLIQAIDDYFLVDCGNEGVYKITESGSFRRVIPGDPYAYAFFKWQGALWATLADSKLAVSADNGDSWRITVSGPDLRSNTIHLVGDSVVAITHFYGGGRLYTLNINQARGTWRLRQLKDDGLNQTAINGLETWGDTVYLATSSGLYKRPLSKFFESK